MSRQDKTTWNRSYKAAQIDTDKKFIKRIRASRRPQQLSETQQYFKDRFMRGFELGHGVQKKPKKLHPDDVEIGELRRRVDDILERHRLESELKEVWE